MYDGSNDTIIVANSSWIPDRIELNNLPEPEFDVSNISIAHEIFNKAFENFYNQSDSEGNESDEIENKVVILNEEFQIEEYEDLVVLSHPLWLLTGQGATIEDAKANLISEAEIFAEYYISLSDEELTTEAIRMRDFIAEILAD